MNRLLDEESTGGDAVLALVEEDAAQALQTITTTTTSRAAVMLVTLRKRVAITKLQCYGYPLAKRTNAIYSTLYTA